MLRKIFLESDTPLPALVWTTFIGVVILLVYDLFFNPHEKNPHVNPVQVEDPPENPKSDSDA